MAIPIGTTSRQLGALARWMYLAVVLLGLLTWWWPDYGVWASLTVGLLIALLLWLCWQTVSANRTVPGHPIYLTLLVPAAVLTYHLTQTGFSRIPADSASVSGALNISLLLHMAMLALAVMLSQSLLRRAITRTGVVRICGAAMIAGGVMAGFRDDAEPVRQAMALVGYAGVAVWLEPVWRPSISSAGQGFAPSAYHGLVQMLSLAVAAAACGLLAWCSPGAAVLAAGGTGITLVAASAIFSRRSRKLLFAGTALVIGSGLGALCGIPLPQAISFGGPLLGSGERAFGLNATSEGHVLQAVSANDSGLHVLCRTIGPWGATLTVAGFAVCLVVFLVRARRDHAGDKARCVAWTVAAMLSAAAMLDRGGLFIPSIVLAFGLTWGLAAEAAGRSSRPRPGITVLVAIGAIMVLIGVAKSGGLIIWSIGAIWPEQGVDKLLHAIFGLILAMTSAWLFGSRNLRRGLVAIVAAGLVGIAGEMIQYMAKTGRKFEWADWGAHAAGCIAATIPYLLCIGARQCESADATGHQPPIRDPYTV